ncbi:endonuclease [Alisedimentitalea sp. MJ-SS2]|uniref:endonuclease/exonuclease/phosphatase family protein n=1 Tax=Aliisedimentitalea sp. MJ-SS2 TaxID=3049795 RepID=UPI00290F0DE9|nr:endonuclease/exonuclease/phosphatase family protein [Alisedimentitalea sp. MJ-SS2]MDU8928442.1 endonuclease [Alisedimentitalea sp. MJ-SS2]
MLAVVACLSVVAGFAGALHPAGDSLAVFQLPLSVVAAIAVIWTGWSRWLRWPLALALTGLIGFHVASGIKPADASETGYALYQKNLLFVAGDRSSLVADIRASGATLVTLQEVTRRNRAVLDNLKADFPAQHFCPFARVGGVAVLSRLPKVPGSERCAERDGLAAMQVEGPDGPVWVVSLHLHWPWPYGQTDHVARLEPVLRGLEGPMLIGGDFNAVAWSHAVSRIEAVSGTRRLGHHLVTFQLPRLGMWIGIDHVLSNLPGGARTETRAALGSDHFGVLARFDM